MPSRFALREALRAWFHPTPVPRRHLDLAHMFRIVKKIREQLTPRWLRQDDALPSPITERSSLNDVIRQLPHALEFLERKYGVRPTAAERELPLNRFVRNFGLPPAQIVFMEIQMVTRTSVEKLSPRQAKKLIEDMPEALILDVREPWESELCQLPRSRPFEPDLLEDVAGQWERDTPILCYCHHGVQSLNAAALLKDRGFTQVFILSGGIDGWAAELDPAMRRYEGNWC